MMQFGCDAYTASGEVGNLPLIYADLIGHATQHDDLGVHQGRGTPLVVSVKHASTDWPGLVVSQRFDPGPEAGFRPGVFLAPERHLLFIGAGTRLLAYDLRAVRRLWEDQADIGFWGWARHGDVVVMSAELELAAWDIEGRKLWTTFVEPPWRYEVRGGLVELDVMGRTSTFSIQSGPEPKEAG